MPNVIFLNDTIVEETAGRLSTMDRGFLYGDGIFETLRSYNKKPFQLEDHIRRLSRSARYFDIPFRYTTRQIRPIIEQLLTLNDFQDAYIRMTLSRGFGTQGLIPADTGNPTFVIHTKPFVTYSASWYKTGISLITSGRRRSATCPVSNHKTLNYLTNYLIKKEAVEKGVHDAIILNTHNHVAECAVSNIFFVEKDTVLTPSLAANILPGVTRRTILELCKENGIHASEELFGLKRVLAANEVFLTNSLIEVMPVSQIDGLPIGSAAPGAITSLLHDKYRALT